jgi:hypothetical protein
MNGASTESRGRLEMFVGDWTMVGNPPGGPPWPGEARVTFAWLDGTPLLVMRTHVEAPGAPDNVAVIGSDGTNSTYAQLYTDDRDVQRIYGMSLSDGVWKLWREGAPFAQRFTGTFSEDGMTITGRWERAQDGVSWETDFDLTYTKVAGGGRA